jgi:hypothetical protein
MGGSPALAGWPEDVWLILSSDFLVLTSKGQQEAIVGLERANELVTAPLLRLEHALH